MNIEKLEGIINTKITELEKEKKSAEESLTAYKFYYTSDLETLGNIVICDSKLELLNELLEEFD